MTLKDVKQHLNKCEVSKSSENFIVYYPIKKQSETGQEIEDLTMYIEQTIPTAEIINIRIKHITYYKGEGIRNKSHYAVKIKIH